MNFKTIEELIKYWSEHYGEVHRFRITEYGMGGGTQIYYWWETLPDTVLDRKVKRYWCNTYEDQHGITCKELEIEFEY